MDFRWWELGLRLTGTVYSCPLFIGSFPLSLPVCRGMEVFLVCFSAPSLDPLMNRASY